LVEIKAIGEEHFKTILALRDKAICEVGELFFCRLPEDKVFDFVQQGRSVGCFDRDIMVGMRLSYTSFVSPDFLEKLPVENDASILGAILYGVYVEPIYRNRGLAKTMTSMVLNMLEEAGIQHIYSTVHPQNTPNLRALQANGFKIVYEGIFYRDKPRCLLYKYLV